MNRKWHKVHSQADFNWFEFRVFILLNWMPNQV